MKPPARIGPYTLVRPLGGQGSRTWLAESRGATTPVALKVVRVDDKSASALLLHEVATAGHLDHPNIVCIHEYARLDEFLWMAMGYVGGSGQLTLANFRQLLLALLHVHGNDVVHGDICPANLLLEPEGDLRLSKFSYSRKIGQAASQEGGRSAYASPEQHLGDVLDTRADIYSAGAVLYEILTRTVPVGPRPAAPSVLAPGLGGNFDALVARALAPDKAARFGHVFEFLSAFDVACQRGVRKAPRGAG